MVGNARSVAFSAASANSSAGTILPCDIEFGVGVDPACTDLERAPTEDSQRGALGSIASDTSHPHSRDLTTGRSEIDYHSNTGSGTLFGTGTALERQAGGSKASNADEQFHTPDKNMSNGNSSNRHRRPSVIVQRQDTVVGGLADSLWHYGLAATRVVVNLVASMA